MALGAGANDILRLVLKRGLNLGFVGILLGLAMAAGITRLLANFLYGVSPFDQVVFTGVPLLLILISLLACWLPARRATRVDPMVVLRSE
jgi:ABC-type antimicrobial peptide transport system permease subunit